MNKELLLLQHMYTRAENLYGQESLYWHYVCTAPRRKIAVELKTSPTHVWNMLKVMEQRKWIKAYSSPGMATLYVLRRKLHVNTTNL